LAFAYGRKPTFRHLNPKEDTLARKTHFTVFRSASEEAERESWDNEGGHVNHMDGVVVSMPGGVMPYKAVLTNSAADQSEKCFATIREAEAFIRRNTPTPISRSTLLDRAAGEGLNPKSPKELPR
jgi:hypothetical protein